MRNVLVFAAIWCSIGGVITWRMWPSPKTLDTDSYDVLWNTGDGISLHAETDDHATATFDPDKGIVTVERVQPDGTTVRGTFKLN